MHKVLLQIYPGIQQPPSRRASDSVLSGTWNVAMRHAIQKDTLGEKWTAPIFRHGIKHRLGPHRLGPFGYLVEEPLGKGYGTVSH